MFRRRPLARAAIVGGGAYAMGKHAQRRSEQEAYQDQQISDLQAQQASAQYAAPVAPAAPAPPPPAPAAAGGTDPIEALERLGKLKEQGILTDAEFEVQKEKILQGM
jgi:hypothetical protein